MTPEQIKQLMRIAHELVDAEALPCWDAHEIKARDKARANALEAMRHIGSRKLEMLGKEPDWGT